MAIPSSAVQALYIAFFNRPADAAGLGFWTAQGDINTVARTFTGSREYAATHAGMSPTALVTDLYHNLFGRTPDAGGLAFWVDALTRNVLDAASLAVELARITLGADGTTLANKLALASSFTTALDTPARQAIFETHLSATSVKSLIDGVGADAATLTAALGNVVPTIEGLFPVVTPPGGGTPPVVTPGFALTTADDTFTGTAADDVITGTVGGASTFNAGDVLDGGAGNNTLALTTTTDLVLDTANVTNVQTLKVKATTATTVSIAGGGGPSIFTNDGSTADLAFGAPGGAGLKGPVTININGATANTDVVYDQPVLAGSSDAATVNLNGVGAAGTLRGLTLRSYAKDANELESLTINATGTNGILLSTDDTQTSLATLNITGAGSLVLEFAGGTDHTRSSLTSIRADSATGDLVIGSITTSVGSSTTFVRAGAGNDTIFMGANLVAGTVVNGGMGTNTVVVTRALISTDVAGLVSIQAIRFDSTDAAIAQDASLPSFGGMNYEVQGSNALTLNGLANGATVKVSGLTGTFGVPANSLDLVLQSGVGAADALNLVLGGNGALNYLSEVAGLETLNISSQGANNVLYNDSVTAKHVITGAGNLDFSSAIVATEVDASGLTGNLNLITAAAGSTITAGSGNDQITGNVGADDINVGTGNNTVTLGVVNSNANSGADRITLGSGNDTVVFVGNNTGGDGSLNSYASFAQILQFNVGAAGATDRLAFSGSNTDFGIGANLGLAKGNAPAGLTAGDTTVVQTMDGSSPGSSAAANVSFFKLTGSATGIDIASAFQAALGTSTIGGLAVSGNYLVSRYDTAASKMVIAVVNVGAHGTLDSTDFTAGGLAVVGVVNMSAADYVLFDGTQLAIAV